MKKQLFAVLGIAVTFAACQGTTESDQQGTGDTTAVAVNSLMGDGSVDAGAADTTDDSTRGRFIPQEDAQAMIDAYGSNPVPGMPTTFYLVSAKKMKRYIEFAEGQGLKDIQLLLGRNSDYGANGLTLIVSGIDATGKHILYPDPNNGNKPSALEHVLPCPPGQCPSSTKLDQ